LSENSIGRTRVSSISIPVSMETETLYSSLEDVSSKAIFTAAIAESGSKKVNKKAKNTYNFFIFMDSLFYIYVKVIMRE
jgi:hypothetical protein